MKQIPKVLVPLVLLPLVIVPKAMAQSTISTQQMIQNTDTEPYQQTTITENETITYQGQTVHMQMQSYDEAEVTKTGVVQYDKQTEDGTLSQRFISKEGKIYSNQGKGWSLTGSISPNYLNKLIETEVSEYAGATVKNIKGGHEFDKTVNGELLSSSIAGVLGLTTNTQSANLLASMFKNSMGRMVLDTEILGKKEVMHTSQTVMVVNLDQQEVDALAAAQSTSSDSTGSGINRGDGTGGSTTSPTVMVIHIDIKTTMSYAKVPVVAPKGVPEK